MSPSPSKPAKSSVQYRLASNVGCPPYFCHFTCFHDLDLGQRLSDVTTDYIIFKKAASRFASIKHEPFDVSCICNRQKLVPETGLCSNNVSVESVSFAAWIASSVSKCRSYLSWLFCLLNTKIPSQSHFFLDWICKVLDVPELQSITRPGDGLSQTLHSSHDLESHSGVD